jgi:hypothetical protein
MRRKGRKKLPLPTSSARRRELRMSPAFKSTLIMEIIELIVHARLHRKEVGERYAQLISNHEQTLMFLLPEP